MNARTRKWKVAQLAIGPILLLIILASVDLSELLRVFEVASGGYIAVAYLVVLPTIQARAVRWWVLLDGEAARPPYRALLSSFAYSIFFSVATPGRLGDFIRTVPLVQAGVGGGRAFSSVVLDRLLDVAFLFAAGSALVVFGLAPIESGLAVSALLIMGFVLSVVCAWSLSCGRLSRGAMRLLRALTSARLHDTAERLRCGFCGGIRGLAQKSLWAAMGLTVVAWLVAYYGNYLFSESLGLGLGYVDVVGISAIASLVSLLPFSILGAGTRDAAMIILLGSYGVPTVEAIALSSLFLSMNVSTGLICGVYGSYTGGSVRLGQEGSDDSDRQSDALS